MKIPHGTQLGGTDGRLYSVFRPGWRLWLWVWWWFTKRPKAVMAFYINNDVVELRVVGSDLVLPRVGWHESEAKQPPHISRL